MASISKLAEDVASYCFTPRLASPCSKDDGRPQEHTDYATARLRKTVLGSGSLWKQIGIEYHLGIFARTTAFTLSAR